jgi:hypothetical protein
MKSLLSILILLALPMLSGCGKTLDQIKQTAHSLIEIGGKIYEDMKDDAAIVKDTAKDIVTPSQN